MTTNSTTPNPNEVTQGAPTPDSQAPGADRTPRQLWQVPLFLSGVTALVLIGLFRPFAGDPAQQQLQRNIDAVRQAITRPIDEVRSTWPTAEQLLHQADAHPNRAAEIYFLAGSSQVRLAESAQGREAQQHWRDARSYLTKAKELGVPQGDSHRVNYRIAKTTLALNEDPELAVEQLKASADHADNLAESYRLLTKAYLHLPKPDLEAALSANEKLRMVPLLNEEVLAPARLEAGELLLRLDRPEEARKVLETIGSQSPPGILVHSRVLRARSFQEEQRWGEAAALWQAALADGRAPIPNEGRILFDLGTCYQRLDQPVEAARTWRRCLERGDGDHKQAAAVALAELELAIGQPEKAMVVLRDLRKDLSKPADWKSSLIEFHRVEKVYEETASSLQTAGAYEQAAELAKVYAPLAEKGKAERLQAESLLKWARQRINQARKLDDAQMLAKETEAASKLYKQASEVFQAAAQKSGSPEKEIEDLWQASVCLQEAGFHADAKQILDNYLKKATDREMLGRAWYALGESLRLAKQPGAEEAYRNCILQAASPWVYRARYQLAMGLALQGKLDDAESELKQNLSYLRDDPDLEAQEKSIFALGDLFFERENYRMAVRHLEEGLQRFPSNPDSLRARYQLAESYRQMASQENQAYILEIKDEKMRAHYQREHDKWLQNAADEFLVLVKKLETTRDRGTLSWEDYTQVHFLLAECQFDLGKYDEALQTYQHLSDRFRGRPESINAKGGIVRCAVELKQFEKVRSTLDEIRSELKEVTLPPKVRERWEGWLAKASRKLPG